MKFRIILTILLSSFVLNIFHDSIISHHHTTVEIPTVAMTMTDNISLTKVHHSDEYRLCDLHKLFHFSAILIPYELMVPTHKVLPELTFIDKISPQQVIESSFKPPKA
jgi:hypothetical protein